MWRRIVRFGVGTTAAAAMALGMASTPVVGAGRPAAALAANCTDSYYVVSSTPLVDSATGRADWSFGYLQLWYSNTCQTNWGRVVVGASGTWDVESKIRYNASNQSWSGGYECDPVHSGGACLSPSLIAPNTPVCVRGEAFEEPSVARVLTAVICQ